MRDKLFPILPQTGSKTAQLSPQRKKSPRMRAFLLKLVFGIFPYTISSLLRFPSIMNINNCYKENELDRNSTVKEYLTVHNEGRRKIRRKINFYNLDVVISVGYRVKSIQGTQFRILAKNGLLLPY